MSTKQIELYMKVSTKKGAAGLDMAAPGQNWVPMKPLEHGFQVSLSVRRDRIQVNLNNDKDEDRHRFHALPADHQAIERAVGAPLEWERKDGVKKNAIRATLNVGYESPNWDEQHAWAIETTKAFKRELGRRLKRITCAMWLEGLGGAVPEEVAHLGRTGNQCVLPRHSMVQAFAPPVSGSTHRSRGPGSPPFAPTLPVCGPGRWRFARLSLNRVAGAGLCPDRCLLPTRRRSAPPRSPPISCPHAPFEAEGSWRRHYR
jgi:hypothetical protein